MVGHTIQGAGVNAACGNRVYRVDVGLSRGCGDGQPEVRTLPASRNLPSIPTGAASKSTGCRQMCRGAQVLEILGDKEVRSLREGGEVRSFTTPKPPQQQVSEPPSRLWQWWRQEQPAVAAAAS